MEWLTRSPAKKSSSKFNDINTLLHKKSNELVEQYFCDWSQRLTSHTVAENLGYIEVFNRDEVIVKIGVTFDEAEYTLPKWVLYLRYQ